EAAPRLAASSPSAPDPAKRSRTAAPSSTWRAWSAPNSASRTRSLVGRVSEPFGVSIRRPPAAPAMILVIGVEVPSGALEEGVLALLEQLVQGRPEPGGTLGLRVLGDQRDGIVR